MGCNSFAGKLVEKGIVREEDIEIYCFGMECLVLKIISFLSCLIIAIFMNSLYEFVIIMLAFIPLRRSAGGYHAKTRLKCYLISCGMLVISLFMCRMDISIVALIGLLFGIDILFLLFAPIDNENKRMDKEEMIFFQNRTRRILLWLNILLMVLLAVGLQEVCKVMVIGMIMAVWFLVGGKIQSKMNNI